MTISVEDAYRECERITGSQARNFSWGIRLLPAPKRRALSAVYAFARRVDDIGDGDLPPDEKLRLLAQARKGGTDPAAYPDDPVLVALDDAARHFPIPLPAFAELVDGCEMDVRGRRYETIGDLATYCRCVAGSIGRLSLGVFDPPVSAEAAATAAAQADELGLALQITNILRDIREDFTNGRVYLPTQDLALFGAEIRLLPDGTVDPMGGAVAEVIRFEAARAAGRYDRGLELLDCLDRRSAACCAAMAGIYRELLHRIADRPEQVLSTRLSLPAGDKLRVAAQALVRGKVGR
jgi:15-cis-phytoene synthase